MEQNPSNKLRLIKKLHEIKRGMYALGSNMEMTVNDLKWYLDLKERGEVDLKDDRWAIMSKTYGDFSNEEIQILIDQLGAD